LFYQLYLRSFADNNGDGIGDFQGATRKMEYLKNLGFDSIWLMPIMLSPSYHGYTISNHYKVNPLYGNFDDLLLFVKKAHKRNIKVILDLPLTHTSVNHNWFKGFLHNKIPFKNWYLELNNTAWLMAKRPWDGQSLWGKFNNKWYYSLFGPTSPSLNYEAPSLVKEIENITLFWLDKGFDGFRFDAAKHIFDFSANQGRFEYQHEKNLTFWKKLIQVMSHFKEELYFIGEVWDEQKVIERYSAVFGAGFNFPLSYAIKESVKERNPARLWQGINATLINKKYIPVNFLNNHDMSRTLTFMNGSKRKTLFSYSILLTLPGMPCIYYGEELGMKGNYHKHYPEEVLEPFPWYQAGAGPFQTQWKASKKNTPYSGISREYQKKNFDSYFNKFKKMLSFRGQRKWIDSATITGINIKNDLFSVFLKNSNHKVHLYYNYSDNKKKIQNNSGTPVEIYGKINYRSHYLEIFPFSTLAVEKRADSISPF